MNTLCKEEVERKIVDYVNKKERCLIPEIAELFDDKGTIDLFLSGFLIWSGVSKEFSEIFFDLFERNEIELDVTNNIEYLICGYGVSLKPVTSKNCDRIKKKNRGKYWMPVVVVPKGKSTSPQPKKKIVEKKDKPRKCTPKQMRDEIYNYVKKNNYCTFPEIINHVEKKYDAKGNFEHGVTENVIMWNGMSKEFSDAIHWLIGKEKIYKHPIDAFTHVANSRAGLKLEVLTNDNVGNIRKGKQYWLPTCFCDFPREGYTGLKRNKHCPECNSINTIFQDCDGNLWPDICTQEHGTFTCECGAFHGVNEHWSDNDGDHVQGDTLYCNDCARAFCLECETEILKLCVGCDSYNCICSEIQEIGEGENGGYPLQDHRSCSICDKVGLVFDTPIFENGKWKTDDWLCVDCIKNLEEIETTEEPIEEEVNLKIKEEQETFTQELTPQDEKHEEFLSFHDDSRPEKIYTRIRKNKEYDPEKCTVYFIQEQGTEFIKIGYTEDIRKRVSQMQTNCPHELRILALINEGKELEKELQDRFAKHHKRGEWFHPSPEIMQYIKDNNTDSE